MVGPRGGVLSHLLRNDAHSPGHVSKRRVSSTAMGSDIGTAVASPPYEKKGKTKWYNNKPKHQTISSLVQASTLSSPIKIWMSSSSKIAGTTKHGCAVRNCQCGCWSLGI